MPSDDDILEAAAKDGSMDYAEWPDLLRRIQPRLDYVVYNEFPIRSIPLPEPLPPSIKDETQTNKPNHPSSQDSSSNSQTSQKENAPPQSPKSRIESVSDSPIPARHIRTPQTASISLPAGTLPPQLLSLFSSIKKNLNTHFSTSPPHTVQRLSELILHPTKHYRTLPSYLRALDRVISVSTTADIYPLSTIAITSQGPAANGGTLVNGTPSTSYLAPSAPSLPSSSSDPDNRDDSLSGAVLTPIPWLRPTSDPAPDRASDLRTESTSLIDGPNGAGSLETVTVSMNGISRASAVPPGNVLRSQPDTALPPVGRQTRSGSAAAAAARKEESEAEAEAEETVHARGPEEIGVEDMGPQAVAGAGAVVFDVEGALGRRGEGERLKLVDGGEDGDGEGVLWLWMRMGGGGEGGGGGGSRGGEGRMRGIRWLFEGLAMLALARDWLGKLARGAFGSAASDTMARGLVRRRRLLIPFSEAFLELGRYAY
ncbi:MAG: hypothetical protein FRX48_01403 [Lasallia pustulata]|uniref:Uncharacterized protein n=1 Tax=Lasallia pustulata TaxID=136370 RepID=A0A5M8PY60_9LECA|nr:MAG: hypothetical protein FRX48_01403 [Lasallia pustulata]